MRDPDRFGEYLLHERLAVGGMGELYLATRATQPDRPLALKILLEAYRDHPDYVSMFQDEARIGTHLAHRNIVGVYEVGEVGDTPYIVMEFVHGENLRSVLRALYMAKEKIQPQLALEIAVEVLLGLDHAHRARDEAGQRLRLVHRDLSPDNILLSYDGEVKILDFGIAKAEGRTTETQYGVLKGKAQYMPPEQANGRAVDARSDLFALGIVLIEALTGEKRFRTEDSLQQYVEARAWTPHGVTDRLPGLPDELDVILMKATQPEPSRRYQNADEFAAALTRLLRGGAVPPATETRAQLLARLFPARAAEKPGSRPPTRRPEPSGQILVRTNSDFSAPPRWASEDDSGPVPGHHPEGESTRLGPGASVQMLGSLPSPRTPKDTRVSAQSAPVAEPSMPVVGAVQVVVDAGESAPSMPRPTATIIAPTQGRPPAVRPVEPERVSRVSVSGPLFPERRSTRSALPAVALVFAAGLIAAAALAAWKWHEADEAADAAIAAAAATPSAGATARPPTRVTPRGATAPATHPAHPSRNATVKVTSSPGGMGVWIDGKFTRKRTPAVLSVPPGTHTLSIRGHGVKPWSWTGRLKTGDSAQLHAELRQ